MKNLIYLPVLNYEFFYLDKTARMFHEEEDTTSFIYYHSLRESEMFVVPNVTIRDDVFPEKIQLCAVYVCSW